MSPALLGRRDSTVSADELFAHADALRAAVDTGGSELDPALTQRARGVLDRVEARMARGGRQTVVAFAGATGSGKSTLFNAVVGAEVATPGARRPTTSKPTAAIWGDGAGAGDLLDWLEVGARHHVGAETGGPDLDGLVLLDLPDFDSRELGNRAEAERILERCDVFVWVTDPQKYADARLHDDYVAAMTHHDAVTVVVLNQADRLTREQTEQCVADLRRLLVRDGLPDAPVIATSARTKLGVDALRERLAQAVAGARAARIRLDADVKSAAAALAEGVAGSEADISDAHRRELVAALARAAGVPTVLDAVRRDYQREAVAATGWPFTRWLAGLRPDPLKRLRLDPKLPPGKTADPVSGALAEAGSELELRRAVGRSSLPVASPAARAAVDLASRRLGDEAGAGLPHRWADAVAEASHPPHDALADSLDQAVMGTPLGARRPLWWGLLGLLQILLAIAVVVGLAWTLVEIFFGAQDLIELPMWHIGPFGLPLVLLVGGLLLGWLIAGLSRWWAATGARRRRRGVAKRLDAEIGRVADQVVIAPVTAVLERHRATREHLAQAGGPGGRRR